jgi:MFS family permease
MTTLYISCTLVGTAFMFIHISMNSVFGAYGTPEERAVNFSWLALGFSISNSIGPLVAGLAIDQLGHAEAMLILAAFPVLGGALVWTRRRALPRPEPVAHIKRSGVIDLLRIAQMRNTFIVSVCSRWAGTSTRSSRRCTAPGSGSRRRPSASSWRPSPWPPSRCGSSCRSW